MNFEFKSTFISHQHIPENIEGCFSGIRKPDHSFWIILINTITLFTLAWLYLHNYIIPATYGSSTDAAYWITAIKMGGFILSSSYAYAATRIIYIYLLTQSFKVTLRKHCALTTEALLNTIRIHAFQFFLLLSILKLKSKGHHHEPGSFTTTTSLKSSHI